MNRIILDKPIGQHALAKGASYPLHRASSFPGSDSENWHRTLTGRQAPGPITAKLRSIYGQVLTEKLPDKFASLLS